MESKQEDVRDEVAYDKLQHGTNPDCRSQASQQIPVSETHALQSDQEVSTPSVTPSKELIVSVTDHSLQLDRERTISSIKSENASETADIIHVPQTGQEGSTPTLREKVSEDGYNWRKYGQKFVRGNEFIRSYYKCTRPSCQAKKQLDYTHNGHIADTIYFGEHCHPKLTNVPLAVGFVVSVVEGKPGDSSVVIAKDKSCNAHDQTPHQIEPADKPQLSVGVASDTKSSPLQLNRTKDEVDYDDRPGSKRRKKDDNCADATPVERPTGEQRVIVQTLSEVDIVNDGYRWRKYGQKLVKGNPNPRNYYRCSSSGCPVKKHVERASHDSKLVITTYEGRHDHDMPPSRTVTQNTAGTNSNKTTNNGESATKLDESDAVCLDVAVNSCSEPQSKSSEDPNGESKTKSKVIGTAGSAMVEQSILDPESKSNEQQNCKTGTIEKSNVGHDSIDVISCEKVRSTDQPHRDSETKSEQIGTACHDAVVHVATCPENNFSEQEQTPKAEAVRS